MERGRERHTDRQAEREREGYLGCGVSWALSISPDLAGLQRLSPDSAALATESDRPDPHREREGGREGGRVSGGRPNQCFAHTCINFACVCKRVRVSVCECGISTMIISEALQ